MANRRELHADLILQSRHQVDSDEGCGAKVAFGGVAKFGASRLRVALGGQLLKHAFLPKIVNEHAFLDGEMPANDGQILPHRSVEAKLLHERVAIGRSFCEEQDAGCVTIDAMHDKGALSLRFQFRGKKRLGGWGIGVIGGHREQFGRFIQGDDGIVFVELDKFARGTRASACVFWAILLSWTSQNRRHLLGQS